MILELIHKIDYLALIDIALMTLLVYTALVLFKRKKATFVLTGILICGFIYLVAYQLNLILLTAVLQGFFAVILIAVIVIFRDELRDFFEEIAVWSIDRKGRKKRLASMPGREVETLLRTLSDLARNKIGALVVIKGRTYLARHLEGGVELNGEISEALLKSLFDPHSIGHDGAVILERDQITQFSTHLPLSTNFKKLGNRGTRHAAALGISEVSDALCLVVSEERGIISVAEKGDIREVHDPNALTGILEGYYRRLSPYRREGVLKDFFKKNYREKGLALLLASILWFVLVYESKLVHRTFQVPVEYPELSSGLEVTQIQPDVVSATFSGPRSAFHFFRKRDIRLSLKLKDTREGGRMVSISESNFNFPKKIVLENFEPRLLSLKIEPKAVPEN